MVQGAAFVPSGTLLPSSLVRAMRLVGGAPARDADEADGSGHSESGDSDAGDGDLFFLGERAEESSEAAAEPAAPSRPECGHAAGEAQAAWGSEEGDKEVEAAAEEEEESEDEEGEGDEQDEEGEGGEEDEKDEGQEADRPIVIADDSD